MSKYIIRLDDACPRRNLENWDRMEALLDSYDIKPLVGLIPNCQDPAMDKYPADENFRQRLDNWLEKGWVIAMHGYNHVYSTDCGGINPMQARSEFAGESLEVQKDKIRLGVEALAELGIKPKVFFAPSHTFDRQTLQALEECSDIRIISDTFAYDSYRKGSFTFVPQQSGLARKLPFASCCFCYHPNDMLPEEFDQLERFLAENSEDFIAFPTEESFRKYSIADAAMSWAYFTLRKLRRRLRGIK